MDTISIRGARTHNLKNIDLDLPRDKLIVITGLRALRIMRAIHMNPEEALLAFQSLRADIMIPMHYGTFRLGFEPMEEPPDRLLAHARSLGIDDRIRILKEGETAVL